MIKVNICNLLNMLVAFACVRTSIMYKCSKFRISARNAQNVKSQHWPLRGFPRKLSQIPDILEILATKINHDIFPMACLIGSKPDHACRENCQLLTSVQVGTSSVKKKGVKY